MELSYDDTMHVKKVYEDFYGQLTDVSDYMRIKKLEALSQLPPQLFSHSDDYFDSYDMSPMDTDFEIVDVSQQQFTSLLEYTTSWGFETTPGRLLRYGIKEKNSGRYIGLIKMGSPVINMKPRNVMLGGVPKLPIFNRHATMGFCIVPMQPFGFNYLGGKLLALICASHFIRREWNKKYNTEICMFETTSLYGDIKGVSQYDGLKPFMRYKGLSESKFLQSFLDKQYDYLRDFFKIRNGGVPILKRPQASYRMKIQNMILGILKKNLRKHDQQMYDDFSKFISERVSLTSKKRYYVGHYGYKNALEYIKGDEPKLIKNVNFDRFEMDNVIEWWRKKAQRRFETIKKDGRHRTEQEIWDINEVRKEFDVIR